MNRDISSRHAVAPGHVVLPVIGDRELPFPTPLTESRAGPGE